MNESELRDQIKLWHRRAKFEGSDHVAKFLFLWLCFNAWLAFESGESRDRKMIDWLKSTDADESLTKSAYEDARASSMFEGYLRALKTLSPIPHSLPGHDHVDLSNTDDFAGIVEGLYQVRCSLFHGRIDPRVQRDLKLVQVYANILFKWVGNLSATKR
jgi:hypothetical protein